MALHLTPEFDEGMEARAEGKLNRDNPYDFWDEYEKCYAWDIGWQRS